MSMTGSMRRSEGALLAQRSRARSGALFAALLCCGVVAEASGPANADGITSDELLVTGFAPVFIAEPEGCVATATATVCNNTVFITVPDAAFLPGFVVLGEPQPPCGHCATIISDLVYVLSSATDRVTLTSDCNDGSCSVDDQFLFDLRLPLSGSLDETGTLQDLSSFFWRAGRLYPGVK
jgi:hypothetical protein